MCDHQRSSGLVGSHPTGRPTVPYRCTIDVRTPWARHGVSTGPPGPDGAPEGPWGRRGVPRGSEYQSCTNTGQSGDLSDDYMLPKIDLVFGFIVTRQTALPIQIVSKFCAGGYGRFQSYCTNAKTHRDAASQVTDLSPALTTCDTERRSPTHPPLARAPRDEITACDQVPHSDDFQKHIVSSTI